MLPGLCLAKWIEDVMYPIAVHDFTVKTTDDEELEPHGRQWGGAAVRTCAGPGEMTRGRGPKSARQEDWQKSGGRESDSKAEWEVLGRRWNRGG